MLVYEISVLIFIIFKERKQVFMKMGISLKVRFCFFVLFLVYCFASEHPIREIHPGFQASQAEWKNNSGLFLLSKNSAFGLGFYASLDDALFSLGIIHIFSSKVVWTADRDSMVKGSDRFVFSNNGNIYLEGEGGEVWSTGTTGQNATSMQLKNSGNLVLLGGNGTILWQSFNYPTDTLLSDQMFWEGMQLRSHPHVNGISNYLEIKSGNLVLYAGYQPPQIYWSIANDSRKTNQSVTGYVKAVVLISNSWNFYNGKGLLLWQFVLSEESFDSNATTWAAVLSSDGSVSFYNLEQGRSVHPQLVIPQGYCSTPEPCDPYFVCYFDNICQCPTILSSRLNCKSQAISNCNSSLEELIYVGDNLNYFSLPYVTPFMISNLTKCQEACLNNCSCMVLFFDSTSGSCYFFNQLGSFQRFERDSGGYISFMKVEKVGDGGPSPPLEARGNVRKHVVLMTLIIIAVSLTVIGVHIVLYCRRRIKRLIESSMDSSEEDNFLDNISGLPVRFRFSQLKRATKNFSIKVGQGGFGSVYSGVLPDGTRLAVKKLEKIGQGAKEFRAEVSLIGSIHHLHLVKLKGFCSEGIHRLLVYEYMSNGSLDKWIFKNNENGPFLDWDTRFNIALSMAKALSYLHEECERKIVHCDIKPENVLLDDNFIAKVSDFGLAKLMNREQSFVCTQIRGTRGYVAPEWITNLTISDKSDVYSYGMVLLEIIGGRKNYDAGQSSEKVHFPSYVFKMLEEQNLEQVVDSKAGITANDPRIETVIKVALWCIQEEMNLRPPMSKVVQMLEGLCAVPPPPTSQMACHTSVSWSSGFGTAPLGSHAYFSEVHLSDVRLSGPR